MYDVPNFATNIEKFSKKTLRQDKYVYISKVVFFIKFNNHWYTLNIIFTIFFYCY